MKKSAQNTVVTEGKNDYNKSKITHEEAGDMVAISAETKDIGEDLRMIAGFRLLDDDFMTMVFDKNIEENPEIINAPSGVRVVACGSKESYSGANTMAGSYNFT